MGVNTLTPSTHAGATSPGRPCYLSTLSFPSYSAGMARCRLSTQKSDYREIRSIKGIDRQLWRWLRYRATLERKSVGEKVNELIEDYRRRVAQP